MEDTKSRGVKPSIEEIRNFSGKYPKQLWFLFTIEMWERFCFYGMRGMLTIFMVDQLFLSEKSANLKYGATQAFVYAFTFIGGIFADKILGFKKSLTFGAIMMILGNALIAVNPHIFFYVGISLVIIGTGFFKPNVSTMVGDLYKEGDERRDAGFSLFYSGINIGALIGGAVCVWLGKYYSWSLAFLSASVVMLIGLVTFELTKQYLGPIGDTPLKEMKKNKRLISEISVYIFSMITIPLIFIMVKNTEYTDLFMYTIGPLAFIYFLVKLFKIDDVKARKKLVAAFILTVFSIVFFAFFEQAGGSLALFANNNFNHKVLFFNIDPNVVNNGANSLFVILLSPLIGLLWLKLSKKKCEPNTVVKFALGFLFLAIAYWIFYATRFFAKPDGTTSLNIFTLAYLAVTVGELCLSPIGLSMITKLSPKNLSGMMMGLWFLASAYGQYFAAILGAGMTTPSDRASLTEKLMSYTQGYHQLSVYALIMFVIVLALSPLIRKLMQEVK